MKSIPFTIENAYSVFGECTGLLHDEGTHLSIEFESTFLWFYKTGVRTVKVPVAEIADVKFVKQLFNCKIVIQAARLALLHDVPGARQGRLEFTIAREHRDVAERFVTEMYTQDNAHTRPGEVR